MLSTIFEEVNKTMEGITQGRAS